MCFLMKFQGYLKIYKDEISDFVEERERELREMGLLKLTNGVPSGNTIRRVVEAVSPDQLRTSLGCARERIVSSLKGCHVIIDGVPRSMSICRAILRRVSIASMDTRAPTIHMEAIMVGSS